MMKRPEAPDDFVLSLESERRGTREDIQKMLLEVLERRILALGLREVDALSVDELEKRARGEVVKKYVSKHLHVVLKGAALTTNPLPRSRRQTFEASDAEAMLSDWAVAASDFNAAMSAAEEYLKYFKAHEAAHSKDYLEELVNGGRAASGEFQSDKSSVKRKPLS